MGVSREYRWDFEGISRVYLGGFEGVSRGFRCCIEGVQKRVSRGLPVGPEGVTKGSRGWSRGGADGDEGGGQRSFQEISWVFLFDTVGVLMGVSRGFKGGSIWSSCVGVPRGITNNSPLRDHLRHPQDLPQDPLIFSPRPLRTFYNPLGPPQYPQYL